MRHGKPHCRGRLNGGGRQCCKSTDIVKCTHGQGDCSLDAACAGNLVCGVDNCSHLGISNCHEEDDMCVSRREKKADCRRQRKKGGNMCRCGRRSDCYKNFWNINGSNDVESEEVRESLPGMFTHKS